MKILLLGGTRFLGRHLVCEALGRGHQVTLFHRGIHPAPEEWPVEVIRGDRTKDLNSLEGGTWDLVIDTSGYLPGDVARSAEALKVRTSHYTFISSISVYRDFSRKNPDEEAEVLPLEDPEETDINAHYGALKAACESAVKERFPASLIVRPGLIVGPYDPSDRFTYWPVRFSTQEKVLAPGDPDQPVQFIDVRDLAHWILDNAEKRARGTYNLTGPAEPLSMRQMLKRMEVMPGMKGKAVFVPETFLEEQNVESWSGLPLWIAEKQQMPGHNSVCIRRALELGLKTRSLEETVGDTLEWYLKEGRSPQLSWGLSRKKEEEVLALWEKQS
ncbi:MAG TPA: NAD-dependent epimerase/dehydratase family protein [Candidatus Mcinerneyibacteriales bacterium]|mgnify:FL=1|nr:NAD-dependent epimerase/dehydratase family protein [Candidatus Mcinerneyibacteriales bacterium]